MNHPNIPQQVPAHPQMQQNVSQQRQVPNIGNAQNVQQKPNQVPQAQGQNPNYNPKLALYVLEKGKQYKDWDEVEAQYQHISYDELRDDLEKWKRKKNSVKAALQEITSATVRRLVNELVDQETKTLWKVNPTLQWKIASIDTEWRPVRQGRREGREIKRVSVLLETELSGLEPQTIKPNVGAGGAAQQVKPNPGMQGQQVPVNGQGGHMQQQKHPQQQHPQQHPGAHGQHFEQQHRPQQGHPVGQGAPPPPPPPPGHGGGSPPPPPPPPGHGGHGGPPHMGHAHPGAMPGAYPPSQHGSKHGHPQIQVMHDERFARQNQPRNAGKGDSFSSSGEDSDWSTEDGSAGSVRIIDTRFERDDRKLRGRGIKKDRTRRLSRSRTRTTSKARSSTKHGKSKHKTRARSSSHHRSSKAHRRSDGEDYISDGRYHSSSSSGRSSRSGDKHRRRRHSRDVSPSGLRFHGGGGKRHSKSYKHHHRMSHDGSEASWRGSDTSSAPTSSGIASSYGQYDRVFDERIGSGRKSSYPRYNSGARSPRHIYEDYTRHIDAHYDDYPHTPLPQTRRRDTMFEGEYPRPPLQRNNTANPFSTRQYAGEAGQYMPQLTRSHTYDERPRDRDAFNLDNIADALLERMHEKTGGGVGRQQRYTGGQPRGAYPVDDEWATRPQGAQWNDPRSANFR